MNKHEVTEVMAILSTVWPKEIISEERIQAYFWSLADEPAEAIQQAVRVWMKTEKWFPKPSELIALAADIEHQQPRQALPAPQREEQRPSEEYIRRVHAKCQAMGVNNPTINRWMAELESENAA